MTDERQKAKEAILARRAKLLAFALAGAGLSACGGKAEGQNTRRGGDGDGDGDGDVYPPDYCLSICLTMVCLTQPCEDYNGDGVCDPYGTGGTYPCLSPCEYVNEYGECLPYGPGGMGGMGGASPSGGADAGTGGTPPDVCLSAPVD